MPALYCKLNARDHAALCLSGGGIRSGSFALGLMQSLADSPSRGVTSLLGQFHYLSTVSGGGYIGSWFSAWLLRDRNARNKGTADQVLIDLADRSASRDEAAPIENLRINSNYLTPKVGAMSADAWADVAMYLRNLILNWFVMLPLLGFLVLAVKAYTLIPVYFANLPAANWQTFALLSVVALLTIFVLAYQTAGRPTQGLSNRDQSWFLWCDLLPMLLLAIVWTWLFAEQNVLAWMDEWAAKYTWTSIYAASGFTGAILYAVAWRAATLWGSHKTDMDNGLGKIDQPSARDWQDCLWWAIAGLLFGLLLVVGAKILTAIGLSAGQADHALAGNSRRLIFLLMFGVPWVLLSHLVVEMLFVGVTSFEQGSDRDREWLARTAGWYGVVVVGWPLFLVWFSWVVISRRISLE